MQLITRLEVVDWRWKVGGCRVCGFVVNGFVVPRERVRWGKFKRTLTRLKLPGHDVIHIVSPRLVKPGLV